MSHGFTSTGSCELHFSQAAYLSGLSTFRGSNRYWFSYLAQLCFFITRAPDVGNQQLIGNGDILDDRHAEVIVFAEICRVTLAGLYWSRIVGVRIWDVKSDVTQLNCKDRKYSLSYHMWLGRVIVNIRVFN